jgi:hypothetical protein
MLRPLLAGRWRALVTWAYQRGDRGFERFEAALNINYAADETGNTPHQLNRIVRRRTKLVDHILQR